jgi:hypothetical protein
VYDKCHNLSIVTRIHIRRQVVEDATRAVEHQHYDLLATNTPLDAGLGAPKRVRVPSAEAEKPVAAEREAGSTSPRKRPCTPPGLPPGPDEVAATVAGGEAAMDGGGAGDPAGSEKVCRMTWARVTVHRF